MARRQGIVPRAFAAVLILWAIAEILTRGGTGLLYAAPAALLALLLVHGCYVAEERLHVLAGRRHYRRRRPAPSALPRSRPWPVERGGSLVGRAMAKRPPPARVALPLAA